MDEFEKDEFLLDSPETGGDEVTDEELADEDEEEEAEAGLGDEEEGF